ncbi:DUF459 domain-containing protein [Pseudomonas purpurea]|uniref:DUF459 domain-containing protein n=1 Tax=Pseudomonas purpurea TaxID=3136737 RepID=UPI003265AB77
MPVSNASPLSTNLSGALKVLYAILVISALLFWFNQDSIRLYCQQKYHDGCEIPGLAQNPQWRLGAQLNQTLADARSEIVARLEGLGDVKLIAQAQAAANEEEPLGETLAPLPTLEPAPVDAASQVVTHPAVTPAPPVEVVSAPAAPVNPVPVGAAPDTPLMATLALGDEVFFVGDSLMQGVAPHMANTLLKRYKVKSINLSRQSTGLAYPSFFNWPKTVESTLQGNRKIRLMVMFLGPNDPWDMPEGKGKPFLRFKTPEWEVAYRQRIDSILDSARAHQVQVIWVGPPNMEKAKLSTAMAYLNGLYKSQLEAYHQHFVSANEILGYQTDEFSYYLTVDGSRKVKTRVDDGIHFTPTGQRLIAEHVLSLINFPSQQLTEH